MHNRIFLGGCIKNAKRSVTRIGGGQDICSRVAGSAVAQRACSRCAGDYEDPERTAPGSDEDDENEEQHYVDQENDEEQENSDESSG